MRCEECIEVIMDDVSIKGVSAISSSERHLLEHNREEANAESEDILLFRNKWSLVSHLYFPHLWSKILFGSNSSIQRFSEEVNVSEINESHGKVIIENHVIWFEIIVGISLWVQL